MTESVRHQGTEPHNPHDASPSQQEPLGEWDRTGEKEPPADQDPRREEAARDSGGPQKSKLPDEPLPPQD